MGETWNFPSDLSPRLSSSSSCSPHEANTRRARGKRRALSFLTQRKGTERGKKLPQRDSRAPSEMASEREIAFLVRQLSQQQQQQQQQPNVTIDILETEELLASNSPIIR